MKELSIEEKAKAYDKVRKKIAIRFGSNVADEIFSQFEMSEDEKIRKDLIQLTYKVYANTDYLTCVEQEKMLAWLEKQGEQTPTDKVKPKFHEGDWTVSNLDKKTRQISEVHFDEYNSYYVVDGKSINLEEYDRLHYLWTIDDAKDGDVLSDGTTIFIFKDLLSDGSVMSYCDYDTDSGENDAFCPLSMNLSCSKITPTTKEQRDLLFAKMKEAGYEWNAELKKIEQKLYGQLWSKRRMQGLADELCWECKSSCAAKRNEWSKEDEKMLKIVQQMAYDIVYISDKQFIERYGTNQQELVNWSLGYIRPESKQEWNEEDKSNMYFVESLIVAHTLGVEQEKKLINWLKSLKERVKPQHKEWSDVDKDILFRIIDDLKFLRDDISKDTKYAVNIVDVEREIAWLKSLRPQNTWKPSDEQINALSIVVKHGQTDDTDALKELLEQLKAL